MIFDAQPVITLDERRLLLDVAARDTLGEGYGAAIYKLLGENVEQED